MRLFLKHLFRSIVKKPLQPIILIITLTLSVSICVFSFSLDTLLLDELEITQTEKFGSSDISVSLNSTSKTRFVFAEDAEKLLGGRANVVGSFELPLFFGEEKETVFGVAVDFYDASEIFKIGFKEYGSLTPSTVSSSVFVTSAFAEENALSVGDVVKFEIAGEKKSYKVVGISEKRFLASYDVMVDITSVMRILAKDSIILSSMGDSFKPSSTLYVDIKAGESVSDCIAALRESEMFSDKEIQDVSKYVKQQSNIDVMRISLSFAIVLSALLCAAVSFSCFYILSLCRAEENASFYAAGARKRQLLFTEYLEIVAYWIIGGSLGLLLSMPLISVFMKAVKFEYVVPRIDLFGAAKGLLCILAVLLLTVAIFDFSSGRKKKSSAGGKTDILLGAVFLFTMILFAIGTFVLPVRVRMISLALMIASMVLASYFSLPPLVRFLSISIAKFAERKSIGCNYPLLYAAKNLYSVKILHNTALLIVLSVSTLLSLTMVIAGGWGSVDYAKSAIKGDYVILNGTDACYEKASESELLSSVDSVFVGTMKQEGASFFNVFSADDPDVFWEHLRVDSLPSGNSAIMSSVLAEMLSVEVGDRICPELFGKKLDLVVTEVTDTPFGYLLFDCEYFGIPKNVIALNAVDGVSKAEVLEDVAGKIALEMATVVPADDLFSEKTKNLSVFLESGKLLIIVLLVFITVGMLDNLFESYRARGEEFNLYRLAGMKSGDVLRMKLYEILITFGFGIFLGVLLMVALSFAINSTMMGYGFSPTGSVILRLF